MKPSNDSPKMLKIRGMFYMLIATLIFAVLNIGQKYILANSAEKHNPIHAFEFTYVTMLYLLFLYLMTLYFTDFNFFPLPEKLRPIFIVRALSGALSHVCYLISFSYISLSLASVIFWTSPVFTALLARIFLKERLSKYDWLSVGTAFLGILLI